MLTSPKVIILTYIFALFYFSSGFKLDDRVIDDISYRFTITMPTDWDTKDLKETNDKYGISYFSYDEYREFLDSGKAHELWERQLTRIAEDMLAIMNIRDDSSVVGGVVE